MSAYMTKTRNERESSPSVLHGQFQIVLRGKFDSILNVRDRRDVDNAPRYSSLEASTALNVSEGITFFNARRADDRFPVYEL